MFAGLFSRGNGINQLGGDQVAIEVEKGRVPANCFGLSLDNDDLFTLYPASEKIDSIEQNERLFFAHPGPYTVRFAPHPETPEVGVEVVLEAQCEDERLARFLIDWEMLSVASLAVKAKEIGGVHLLQPGLVQEEIDLPGGVRARFSNEMQEYGFSCNSFKRVDLSNEVDTATQLWQELALPETEVPPTDEVIDTPPLEPPTQNDRDMLELAVSLGAIKKAKVPGAPIWRIEALDNKLATNLSRDLPYLKKRLSQIRAKVDDRDYFQQLREWERQLERIRSRVGSLPVLKSDIVDLQLDKAEQRRRVARLKQAVALLRSLKSLTADIEQAGAIAGERLQQEMSHLICEIEWAVRFRAGSVEDDK